MTSLYLHGLNSYNQTNRTEWLQQFDEVVKPLLLYQNIPKTYKILTKNGNIISFFLPLLQIYYVIHEKHNPVHYFFDVCLNRTN